VGVDERAYPRDFAAFVSYHAELRKIPARATRRTDRCPWIGCRRSCGSQRAATWCGWLDSAGKRRPVRDNPTIHKLVEQEPTGGRQSLVAPEFEVESEAGLL
jgi:hypothetical protein